jgi:hypothetical protein
MGIKIQESRTCDSARPTLTRWRNFSPSLEWSGRSAPATASTCGPQRRSFPAHHRSGRAGIPRCRLRSRISQGSRDSRSRGEDLDRRVDSDHLQCSSHVRLLSYNLFALNYLFTLLWAGQRRPLVREAIAHSRRDSESQLKGIMKDTGKGSIALESKATKKKPGPVLSMGANKVADLDVSAGHLIDCQRVES